MFDWYLLETSFQMRDRKSRSCREGRVGGEELEGVESGETVIRMCCMKRESISINTKIQNNIF